jgi:hypothetical protein
MIVSCDDNKNKNSNNQHLPPNQFVLFGDLLFNQKEDGSRQSAYIQREYYFEGDTFKLNLTPTYDDGLLRSLFCSTIWNPINYSTFSKFLSLNYVQCQTGYSYENFPDSVQRKINEMITLNGQLIEIERNIHEFKKSTQLNYIGSDEFKNNQVNIASICLQSVFLTFDGNSVVELDVPFHSYDTRKSLMVSSLQCNSYQDWIELRKNMITGALTRYTFLRNQYGF